MIGFEGKVCHREELFCCVDDADHGYDPWDDPPLEDTILNKLLRRLNDKKVHAIIFGMQEETDRDYQIRTMVKCYMKHHPPFEWEPIYQETVLDYIVSGGNSTGLIAWNELKSHLYPPSPKPVDSHSMYQPKNDPPKKDPQSAFYTRTGKSLCKSWMDGLITEQKVECYPCAPKNSLLYPLSPEKGTVTIIGGPPGVGKTALTMQVINESLYCDRHENIKSILVVNTDQAADDLWQREMSRCMGIPLADMRNNLMLQKPEYQLKWMEALSRIKTLTDKIHFYTKPPITMESIEQAVKDLSPRILVLDHINEIRFMKRPKIKDQERLGEIMAILRGFASQGIAVIGLCAFNRTGATKAKYGQADFSALRGSSSIEYCATKIWFLRSAKNKSGQTHILEMGKSKETALTTNISLNFDGSRMQFTVAESREDVQPQHSKSSPKPKKPSSKKKDVDEHGGTFFI